MNKGITSLEGIKPRDLYTMDGQDVWEVVSTCQHPSIELKNLRTGDVTRGAIGSPIVGDFVKLVPQGAVK